MKRDYGEITGVDLSLLIAGTVCALGLAASAVAEPPGSPLPSVMSGLPEGMFVEEIGAGPLPTPDPEGAPPTPCEPPAELICSGGLGTQNGVPPSCRCQLPETEHDVTEDDTDSECLWVAAWSLGGINENKDCDLGPVLCATLDNLTWLEDDINEVAISSVSAVPQCFLEHFTESCPIRELDLQNGSAIFGLCYLGPINSVSSTLVDLGMFLGVPASVIVEASMQINAAFENGDLVPAVHWFMDADCKYVSGAGEREICGYAGMSPSPVSLIWNNEASLEDGMTVVSFPLSPDRSRQYCLWKASADAPLLVYDPEHRGRVSSARQLFGNFTYGPGLAPASQVDSQAGAPFWQNGYEAMAALDANDDGELSEGELDALYLWFDHDRDAVADLGELKHVRDEGIISLHFRDVEKIPGSKDLFVEVGYRRRVDGKIVTGRSVDWFSSVFSSKQEAVLALRAMFDNKRAARKLVDAGILEENARVQNWPTNPAAFAPHRSRDNGSDLSGYWLWRLENADGLEKNPSVFALEQVDNHVFGYSVLEVALRKNSTNVSYGVTVFPLRGRLKKNSAGERELVFAIYDERSNTIAKSNAVLSADGTKLSGTTMQSFSAETAYGTRSATVNYTWRAEKVALPGAPAPAVDPRRDHAPS